MGNPSTSKSPEWILLLEVLNMVKKDSYGYTGKIR
jgi:hypothetical protein